MFSSVASPSHQQRSSAVVMPDDVNPRITGHRRHTGGAVLQQRLNVAVLVDLVRHPGAGGHVKAWERFADAATLFPNQLNLTVYYLGDGETEERLSDNVRIRTLPPAFGTGRIPWLRNGGGDTDLASYNPHLARYLLEYDVFHATSAFAFAKTAETISRRQGRPLVSSVHTDAAKFAEVYTGEIVEQLLGPNKLSRWLIETIGVGEISARNLNRARDRLLRASDHILVSNPDDSEVIQSAMPYVDVSPLRRGIDQILFSPKKRDRAWIEDTYGVPADVPVILFAGRVDESKRVLTVAKAAKRLIDNGQLLHVMIAGTGSETGTIKTLLGTNATLAGNVSQEKLARLMASADFFAFPSESETFGNVVIEAKASGLPVLVTAGATTAPLISSPGVDGLLARDSSIDAYVDAMAPLLIDPATRRRIGQAARQQIERSWPDWSDVMAEDLLPIWQRAHERVSRGSFERRIAA